MTNEERDLIQNFIARIGGTPANSGFSSVPATQPALPPVDREADAHIAALFASYPEARYRITQLAFMQEHALAEAQNQMTRGQTDLQVAAQRIQQLQQQLQQQQAAPQPVTSPWGTAAGGAQPLPQPQPQQPRGFFGGLFGGGQQAAPPPQPQYQQPQYQQPQYAPPAPQYAPDPCPPTVAAAHVAPPRTRATKRS